MTPDNIFSTLVQIPFLVAFIWFSIKNQESHRKDLDAREAKWIKALQTQQTQFETSLKNQQEQFDRLLTLEKDHFREILTHITREYHDELERIKAG